MTVRTRALVVAGTAIALAAVFALSRWLPPVVLRKGAGLESVHPTTVTLSDPLHGWVGGANGIWGTGDAGKTWTHLFSSRDPIVHVESVDPNSLWALTASLALVMTHDGGKSWTRAMPTAAKFSIIDFTSPTFGAATDGRALYLSQDGGTTWTSREGPVPIATLSFADSENGWIAGGGEVWYTGDGGKTWSMQLMVPGGDVWRGRTSIRFTSKSTGWALFCLGQGAASQEPYVLYGTSDGGRNWTPRLVTPGLWLIDMPALDAPSGPGGYPVALAAYDSTAWVAVHSPAGGYLEVVQVAADGSAPAAKGQISVTSSRPPVIGLSFASVQDGWIVTGASRPKQGAVLRTTDGGQTWTAD